MSEIIYLATEKWVESQLTGLTSGFDGTGGTYLTVFGKNSVPGTNGNDLASVYNIAKTLNPNQYNPVNILIYPGYYGMGNQMQLDTPYINLISATGNIDVNIGYDGAIILSDNIRLYGIKFMDGGLSLTGNYPGIWIEHCHGYINADTSGNYTEIVLSGTFIDLHFIGDGQLSNCDEYSGYFKNIYCQWPLFNSIKPSIFSGYFENINSIVNIFNGNDDCVYSGTFINCIGDSGGNFVAGKLSGEFINCVVGNGSFNGICSGILNYCIGGAGSFNNISGGTLNYCVGGQTSFSNISGGTLNYCKITTGTTFPTPTNGGTLHLCIDGNGKTIDSSIYPQSLSLTKSGINNDPNPQRFQWFTDKTISQVLLTNNCSGVTVSINSTTYNETSLVGITLPAMTDIVILDVAIQTGYNNANAIIVF